MNNEIYIVGGGTSLLNYNFDHLKGRDIIVINKAFLHVPNAKYFVTMDVGFLNKTGSYYSKFKEFKATKIFILNLANKFIKEEKGKIVDTRWNYIYKLNDFDIIIKSYNKGGMGYNFKDFRNGGNSGYCGLQLAVLLGYKKINLLGIDLIITENTHFHGGYGENYKIFEKKLLIYYDQFKKGLKELKKSGIKVYSCSKISKLNQIIPYKRL